MQRTVLVISFWFSTKLISVSCAEHDLGFIVRDTVVIIKYSYLILLLSSIFCSVCSYLYIKIQRRHFFQSQNKKLLFLLKKKHVFSSLTMGHWKPVLSFYFGARNFLNVCPREWNSHEFWDWHPQKLCREAAMGENSGPHL